ncbi:MAG: hypothetical protein AAF411_22155 [Myxococcota bacterium]
MDAYVEVTIGGNTERHPIEGSQITLGKSGTATISLPTAHELELEHLLIAPRGKEGCWVSTSQGALTPTKLRGKPFASGMVKWGSELVLGKIRIKVTNKKAKVKGEGPSPIVAIGGIAIVGILAFMFLRGDDGLVPSAEGIEPPNLFPEAEPSCEGDGDVAERARQAEYAGDTRGDRYHYDPGDGVLAVADYGRAAACLRSLGRAEEATDVEAVRTSLRESIESDYAGLRLHLGHALDVSDWSAATRDAERLTDLTQHLDDDPYTQWLEQTLRIVRAKAQREEQNAED